MRRMILMIGLVSLIINFAFAADQEFDRKQIYELRKECGESAAKYAQRWRLCDGKGDYQSHYNTKLNVCLIYITASCTSDKKNGAKFWAELLADVDENKTYGTYVGSGKVNDPPAMCHVRDKQCNNLSEFRKLIKPYMEE